MNERAVKFHVGAILAKLEVVNRTQAVMLAVERGIITFEKDCVKMPQGANMRDEASYLNPSFLSCH